MTRIALAVIHLLALGIGLAAIFLRARASHRISAGSGPETLRRIFGADNAWGIAALMWISTGLWRWFGGTEKSPSYYWSNHIFQAKMGFLALVLALELWPMATLIRWRISSRRGTLPPLLELAPTGRRIARISDVQTLLIIAMVVAAVMMARGYGAR